MLIGVGSRPHAETIGPIACHKPEPELSPAPVVGFYGTRADYLSNDKILSDTVGVTDSANIVNVPCHYTSLHMNLCLTL